MDIEHEITNLERLGWHALSGEGGADFYREHMADEGRMVFSMGVVDKETAIAAIEAAPPWESHVLEHETVVPLSDDAAMITYRATAHRTGQDPYSAWMSTVFVKRDGAWKVVLHQQSPTESSE